MKSADLKPGESYAYAASGYDVPVRVTCISACRAKGEARGETRISFENGREAYVPVRRILEPWAPYAERKAKEIAFLEERRLQHEARTAANTPDATCILTVLTPPAEGGVGSWQEERIQRLAAGERIQVSLFDLRRLVGAVQRGEVILTASAEEQ